MNEWLIKIERDDIVRKVKELINIEINRRKWRRGEERIIVDE